MAVGEARGQRVAAAVQRVQDLPRLGGAFARGQEGGGDLQAAAPAARRAGGPPDGLEKVSAVAFASIFLAFCCSGGGITLRLSGNLEWFVSCFSAYINSGRLGGGSLYCSDICFCSKRLSRVRASFRLSMIVIFE